MSLKPLLMRAEEASQLLFMVRQLTREDARVIELIAPQPKAGTSTLALDLALLTAEEAGRPILLLDLGQPRNAQADALEASNLLREDPWGTMVLPASLGGQAFDVVPVENSTLMVSRRLPPGFAIGEPPPEADVFLAQLKSLFEWVIIDAPAPARSFDGIIAASMAEAVVMVLVADNTRAPVADKLRDQLVDARANLAGVLLNRRRFYIPRFLYRHL
ncbi:MAG: hypothetical protein EAZ99_09125 [Alphaproteobacteria bacterium]|nr:hypothetical protein [Alphaproteobacteria bacterium]TAD89547.1 MAG: hypothetical protein EAZ99_09125 [Alphaproteobacteria bacterium]